MKNDALMLQQAEYLYRATAKHLYNMALYAVGNKSLAEQTAASAFTGAYSRLRNKSDIALFELHFFRLLYQYGKKACLDFDYPVSCIHDVLSESISSPCVSDQKHLAEMLICLNFEERYIVLLFCLQKYSVHQIAKITRLPCFIIERRLKAAVNKAMR